MGPSYMQIQHTSPSLLMLQCAGRSEGSRRELQKPAGEEEKTARAGCGSQPQVYAIQSALLLRGPQ